MIEVPLLSAHSVISVPFMFQNSAWQYSAKEVKGRC
jgi:hypothetical protein